MNSYRVLKVSGGLAVASNDAPAIWEERYLVSTEGYHRLDGDAESVLELLACTTFTIVWDSRIFVHVMANAVSDKLADNAVASFFTMVLDCSTDIAETIAGACGLYAR